MRIDMIKNENGRMKLNDIGLIEYESLIDDEETFFLQSGVVGFNATKQELHDIYGLLNYYFNIDSINSTVISLK
jgi:hypothetical protein